MRQTGISKIAWNHENTPPAVAMSVSSPRSSYGYLPPASAAETLATQSNLLRTGVQQGAYPAREIWANAYRNVGGAARVHGIARQYGARSTPEDLNGPVPVSFQSYTGTEGEQARVRTSNVAALTWPDSSITLDARFAAKPEIADWLGIHELSHVADRPVGQDRAALQQAARPSSTGTWSTVPMPKRLTNYQGSPGFLSRPSGGQVAPAPAPAMSSFHSYYAEHPSESRPELWGQMKRRMAADGVLATTPAEVPGVVRQFDQKYPGYFKADKTGDLQNVWDQIKNPTNPTPDTNPANQYLRVMKAPAPGAFPGAAPVKLAMALPRLVKTAADLAAPLVPQDFTGQAHFNKLTVGELVHRHREKTAEYALGIPDRKRVVPIKEHTGRAHLTIHSHHANRAGHHYDVRVALGDQDAHSWATRRLPEPGETVLAKQQPTHTRAYMDWSGTIPKGYGAGKVAIHQKGDVDVVESGAHKIVFNRHEGRKTHEYVLIRTRPENPADWLMMNRTTRHGQYAFPQTKEHYAETHLTEGMADRPGSFQPKIDGAHALVVLRANRRPRVFSHRVSKRGDVLEYTHKIPGLFAHKVPTGHGDKVLRAEVYLADLKGRPLPAERTSAVLNSGVERAIELQRGTGGLRIMPFDIHGDKRPYAARLQKLEGMAQRMPFLTLPDTARTPDEARKLIRKVMSGTHPLTREGVVHWDPEGRPTKAKLLHDVDVHVREVYPGEGKHLGRAGGFTYSRTPDGPIVGRVGTGLSHRERAELWKHREADGRVASIVYEKPTNRGSLYAPRFSRWHPDKDTPPERTKEGQMDQDRVSRIVKLAQAKMTKCTSCGGSKGMEKCAKCKGMTKCAGCKKCPTC